MGALVTNLLQVKSLNKLIFLAIPLRAENLKDSTQKCTEKNWSLVEFLSAGMAGMAARAQASRQASLDQTQEYRSAQCISPSIVSVSNLV